MDQGDAVEEGEYGAKGTEQLETIWGEGFMSPGGPAEVGRILKGAEVAGAAALDIGCGTGGAAFVLANDHGAASVTGVDVEPYVIDRASQRAVALGVAERVRFATVQPGPLPFADASFDLVFSKDALIHVQDKQSLYAEAFRVLRPGGWLCVGDWLRGEGVDLDADVEAFSGEEFFMQSLAELGALVSSTGFVEIELEDRREWYHEEAKTELERLRGPLQNTFLSRLGQEMFDHTVEFWEGLVESTHKGVLRPGHVRARKPEQGL